MKGIIKRNFKTITICTTINCAAALETSVVWVFGWGAAVSGESQKTILKVTRDMSSVAFWRQVHRLPLEHDFTHRHVSFGLACGRDLGDVT